MTVRDDLNPYNVVVIGAGLGGLLAAARMAKEGNSVLVLERLRYVGGRFTTVSQEGCQITTGALHMAPHGASGPLARSFRTLGLPFTVAPRDVYASFFLNGRHIRWERPWDIFKLVGSRGTSDLVRIVAELALRECDDRTTFADWLARRTTDETTRLLFESFTEFALSVRFTEVSCQEMHAIFRSLLRYGMPSVPVGGCTAVIESLVRFVTAHGGEIRTGVEALRILTDLSSGRATGVEMRERHTGQTAYVDAKLIVSDVGPAATEKLLGSRLPDPSDDVPKATGLKLHILSDRSLIPHNGIMFCLGLRRISGMVEVTRSIPALAPGGTHLIDTFQVRKSDSFGTERDLALADLRDVFGEDFDRHCRLVRASAFYGDWPVNRAVQGRDLDNRAPVPGLLMVGDAYKPTGHMMVEGVAASVEYACELATERGARSRQGVPRWWSGGKVPEWADSGLQRALAPRIAPR